MTSPVPLPVLLVIALGGALGSCARWAVGEAVGHGDPGAWPWATLAVNLVGALAIGVLASPGVLGDRRPWLRPFLITGVLGGFTTFSALALETGVMLDAGHVTAALGYLAITLAAGLAAVRVGNAFVGRRPS